MRLINPFGQVYEEIEPLIIENIYDQTIDGVTRLNYLDNLFMFFGKSGHTCYRKKLYSIKVA